MARVAAVLPGYASVARAAEVLHLAPRSVRDLIYAGRLPSARIGRLHYVRASDLEAERRRRLGLRLPARRIPRRQAQPDSARQAWVQCGDERSPFLAGSDGDDFDADDEPNEYGREVDALVDSLGLDD